MMKGAKLSICREAPSAIV